MTLVSSGKISIKNQAVIEAGANRNIAQEVDGNNTGPKSLWTLGGEAGKQSGGVSLTEFYTFGSTIGFNTNGSVHLNALGNRTATISFKLTNEAIVNSNDGGYYSTSSSVGCIRDAIDLGGPASANMTCNTTGCIDTHNTTFTLTNVTSVTSLSVYWMIGNCEHDSGADVEPRVFAQIMSVTPSIGYVGIDYANYTVEYDYTCTEVPFRS